MRQCRPLAIGGRSRPKRALTASATCPFGKPGFEGAAAAGGGLAGGVCSIGPLGATVVGAGWAGGPIGCAGPGVAFGTSAGGRMGGSIYCPGAAAGQNATSKAAAAIKRPLLPALFGPILI